MQQHPLIEYVSKFKKPMIIALMNVYQVLTVLIKL